MVYLYYFILLLVLLVGLLINLLSLPGLWLMVSAYGLYGLLTRGDHFDSWPSLITLILLGLIAECVEFFAGAAGSKAAGGRRRGMIGAVVGAFLGAIFLSIIPIIVVAQIVGACLGAFIGAAVMEFSDKDFMHSMRVGYGAAKGRLYGIVAKLAFGALMFVIAAFAALPLHFNVRRTVVFPPASAPAITAPAITEPANTSPANTSPAITAPATSVPTTAPATTSAPSL